MSDVNFTNHMLLVRSLDKNSNGVMDELQAAEHVKAKVDTNRNGQIERQELLSALKADSVEINKGNIVESRGTKIFTHGLETLQNVNITAKNAKTYVWNMPSDLKGQGGYSEVLQSNREYASAIRSMRTSLETIKQSTGNMGDQTSRTINITAKNAISTERALNFENLLINLLDKPNIYDNPFANKPNYGGGKDIHKDPFSNRPSNGGSNVHSDPFSSKGGRMTEDRAMQIASEVGNHDGWVSKEDLTNAGYAIPEHVREQIAGSDSRVTIKEFASALMDGTVTAKGATGSNSVTDDPFSNPGNGGGSTPSVPEYDPYEDVIRTQKEINNNMRTAYTVLNNALQTIKEQTDNLPDVKKAIRATDNSITAAFSNIEQIKNDSQSPEQVKEKLYGIARNEEGKVANRTAPYGGVGAGIGAVAGGVIGYLATKNVKTAALAAGGGAVVAGGIGALIGNSIDQKHKDKASSLRTLGDEVVRFDLKGAERKVEDATIQTYNEMLGARDKNDLDNARVSTNNLNSIRVGVANVESESAKILGAYKMR